MKLNELLNQLLGLQPEASDLEIYAFISGLKTLVDNQRETVTRLEKNIADRAAADAQAADDEAVIAMKMAHGLSREQSIAVIRRQRRYDAQQAQATAEPSAPAVNETTPESTAAFES